MIPCAYEARTACSRHGTQKETTRMDDPALNLANDIAAREGLQAVALPVTTCFRTFPTARVDQLVLTDPRLEYRR